jgi:hypothetical protein
MPFSSAFPVDVDVDVVFDGGGDGDEAVGDVSLLASRRSEAFTSPSPSKDHVNDNADGRSRASRWDPAEDVSLDAN